MDFMKKLPKEISRNGYRYILMQRTQNKAMYKQTNNNALIAFEVFRIRIQRARFSILLRKYLDESERFPGNSDFGKTAWSIQNYQDALKKYQEL